MTRRWPDSEVDRLRAQVVQPRSTAAGLASPKRILGVKASRATIALCRPGRRRNRAYARADSEYDVVPAKGQTAV